MYWPKTQPSLGSAHASLSGLVLIVLGCGPRPDPAGGADGTGGDSDLSTSTTSGAVDDTGPVLPPLPPSCNDTAPDTEVPPTPEGCTAMHLPDANGDPDPTRPAGWWNCTGALERVAATSCSPRPEQPLCVGPDFGWCEADGSCEQGRTCAATGSNCQCLPSDCMHDDDCCDGFVCLCAMGSLGTPIPTSRRNHCVPAECRAVADCAAGEQCQLELADCGVSYSMWCTDPMDECVVDDDCLEDFECSHVGLQHFTCTPSPHCL